MLKAAVNTMAKISLVARRLLIFKIALVIHFSTCSLVMRAIVRSILDSEAILAGDRDCFGGGTGAIPIVSCLVGGSGAVGVCGLVVVG